MVSSYDRAETPSLNVRISKLLERVPEGVYCGTSIVDRWFVSKHAELRTSHACFGVCCSTIPPDVARLMQSAIAFGKLPCSRNRRN